MGLFDDDDFINNLSYNTKAIIWGCYSTIGLVLTFFDIYILPSFLLYPSCIFGIFAFAFFGMMSERADKKDKGEAEE